jgi:hypothetical protein
LTIAITAITETALQRTMRLSREPVKGHLHHTSGTIAAKKGKVANSKGEYPPRLKARSKATGSITAQVTKSAATPANQSNGAQYQHFSLSIILQCWL